MIYLRISVPLAVCYTQRKTACSCYVCQTRLIHLSGPITFLSAGCLLLNFQTPLAFIGFQYKWIPIYITISKYEMGIYIASINEILVI